MGVPHADGGLPPFTVSEVQSALNMRRCRNEDEEDTRWLGWAVNSQKGVRRWRFDGVSGLRLRHFMSESLRHKQVLYPYKLFGVLSYLGEQLGPDRHCFSDEERQKACKSMQKPCVFICFHANLAFGRASQVVDLRYEPLNDLPTRSSYARVESELGADVLILNKKDLLELRSEFPACASIWLKVARRKEWHRGQLLEELKTPRAAAVHLFMYIVKLR